jgi:sugar phosphate isomerase/epimerase
MKFAFSTLCCPTWEFPTIVARAKEYGYDGVEIRGFLNESILTAANVFLTDPAKIRRAFEAQGIQVAALAGSVMKTGSARKDAQAAADLRLFIDTAHALGCGLVKISDTQVRPGQGRAAAAVALGQWLMPLGDYAAERDVTIVVENLLSFRTSREMWTMLEAAAHPAVACCWDVFNAALVGESPMLSVPTLNSRIQYVHVKDAKLGALGATFCKLGEGDVAVQVFLTRLQGIGYGGWVTLEWEKAWLPGLAEPEEILPDSIAKLRRWTRGPVEETQAPAEASAH